MRGKVINLQVLIEFFCYIIFCLLILYLIISGEYLSYVTPRMKPYLFFTSFVMAVWACTGLRRLFLLQYKLRVAHCFVLVLPIILLIIPHKPISASELSSGYVKLSEVNTTLGNNNNQSTEQNFSDTTPPATEDSVVDDRNAEEDLYLSLEENNSENEEISSEGSFDSKSDMDAAAQNILNDPVLALTLSGYDKVNKTITVSDEEFYPWLTEIFTNMNEFDGYQIAIKGFVFKDDPELKDYEFVASRLLMSCCTADLVPCGIVCQYDQIDDLQIDTWITVEGVIKIGKYMGNDEPQITVTKISEANKPEDEYIYPY